MKKKKKKKKTAFDLDSALSGAPQPTDTAQGIVNHMTCNNGFYYV